MICKLFGGNTRWSVRSDGSMCVCLFLWQIILFHSQFLSSRYVGSRVSNGCAERHRLLYFRSAIPGCSMCITRPAPGWRGPLQTRRPRAAADWTQLVRVHLLPRSDSSSWSEFICCNLRRRRRSNDRRSSRAVGHACLHWAKTNCDIRRATTKYKLINLN